MDVRGQETNGRQFRAPLGFLGRVAEFLFLRAYMKRFLVKRNVELKTLAEGNAWRQFMEP